MKGAKGLIAQPAHYLLRFDDLCPAVSRERWRRCRALIEEFQIRPILAVVADNQDAELQVSPPDPEFWSRIREMESAGAAIGLHGYRHLCVSRGRSLVPLSRVSEFAGVAAEIQREWIREGLHILRSRGLDPKIWVAPRHGFDQNTLHALRAEGMLFVSDGFTRRPFLRDELVWIPQQLWAPVKKVSGLWTICVHANTASDTEIAGLRSFLCHHAKQFTSLERALEDFPPGNLSIAEKISAKCALWQIRASRAKGDLWNHSRRCARI